MEVEMSTKEKIINEALRLFSNKGYDGVSMREIAAAVGIKGASIYNHFKGKEDIFQGIFDEMTKQYNNMAGMMNVPIEQNDATINVYKNIEEEQLIGTAEELFEFFTQNEFIVMFRKLLMSEQHKSPIAAKYLKEYYLEAPVLFQSQIFEGIQREGKFKAYNAETMALHFFSPVYYTLCRFDLGCPYKDCLEQIKQHVHQFCQIYR